MSALIKLKQIETIPQLILPVPHIVLASPRDPRLIAYNTTGADFTLPADGSIKWPMRRMPLVTVMDIPDFMLTLNPRLELLWFRRERRNRGGGGNGYRHPTHTLTGSADADSPMGAAPVSPVLANARFRGGLPANKPGCVSEWDITKVGQKFFVDSLGHHMKFTAVNYIDTAGGVNQVKVICPSFLGSSSKNANQSGFGYSAQYRPSYFQFRYSVEDPKDARNRLVGPATKTIVCAHHIHPFVQDAAASAALGLTCNNIHSRFKDNELNCWFATRLPA